MYKKLSAGAFAAALFIIPALSYAGVSFFSVGEDGNIGIGTSTPAYKLDVLGDIRSSGTVRGSGLEVSGSATSTFTGGINLSSGCFAVSGVCLGSATSSPSATILVASDDLKVSADTERSDNNTTATKIKEVRVYLPGTVRVSFDLKGSGGANSLARIYKNGVEYGSQRQSFGSYTTFTEDLSFAAGDSIQLYVWKQSSGNGPTYVQNFRLSYDYVSSDPGVVVTN